MGGETFGPKAGEAGNFDRIDPKKLVQQEGVWAGAVADKGLAEIGATVDAASGEWQTQEGVASAGDVAMADEVIRRTHEEVVPKGTSEQAANGLAQTAQEAYFDETSSRMGERSDNITEEMQKKLEANIEANKK